MKIKWLSDILIVLGILMILIALCMFYDNYKAEELAETSSEEIVKEIYEIIEDDGIDESNDSQEVEPLSDSTNISEDQYLGILYIPSLDLELPVQNTWSYDKLNISPCLYQSEPMSIAAHNYQAHFGNIDELELGDGVTLLLVNGEIIEYEVVLVDKIYETQVEELEDSQYDLTLFTCNYSNNTERILVRLKQI